LCGAGLVPAALPTVLASPSVYVAWIAWLAGCGALLAIELLLLPARKSVHVRIEVPEVAYLGDPLAIAVHAASARATALEVQIELAGDADELPPVRLAVARDAPQLAELPLRAHRRGTLVLAASHVRWSGPLRLLWCETATSLSRKVRIVANVRAVRARAARMVENREFTTGLKVERYLGDGSDFDSLREFVTGMDRRAIDWKATARHREVLCREYRAERDHAVMLCLDTGRLMGEPLHGVPRLDHAMLAALQLAYVCLRTGDRVGMFAFADRPQQTVLPQAGVHALQAIQNRLTALDYSTAETNFTLAMTSLLQQLRRRTLVVLFTDFVDGVTAELMLRNVSWLARRHVLLFVAMRDPLLGALAEREPRSVEDLHRAVVADEIRNERLLVLERIRRAGAQVLDTDVDRLEPGLIQRYLQVKRRELV
jgi:uncharacterized protein (DUF58 family)